MNVWGRDHHLNGRTGSLSAFLLIIDQPARRISVGLASLGVYLAVGHMDRVQSDATLDSRKLNK